MNKLILITSLALLAGCEPTAREQFYPVLPDGLIDCRFYYITDQSGGSITVARCPMSTTTTQMSNKAHTKSVVIDGKEYTAK